jgi:hypothetical protein
MLIFQNLILLNIMISVFLKNDIISSSIWQNSTHYYPYVYI